MDRLSTEILFYIFDELYVELPYPLAFSVLPPYLPLLPRRHYAAVSRQWQRLAEAHNFAEIRLKSSDLSDFSSIFADPRRGTLLRRLEFTVELPTHGDSRQDHASNDAATATAIHALFKTISSWDSKQEYSNASPLELSLCIEWSSQIGYFNERRSSIARRYLTLQNIELPSAKFITSFSLSSSTGRALHPSAVGLLVRSMPLLDRLALEIRDPDNKRSEMRKDHRMAFAAAFNSWELPQLRHLEITQQGLWLSNHSFECPNLEDDDSIDLFNEAIYQLGQRSPLENLVLHQALVSTNLFAGNSTTALPAYRTTWPYLKTFSIHAQSVAPSGIWYYTGDPGDVEPGSGSPFFHHDDDLSVSGASDTEPDDDIDGDLIVNGARPSHRWRTVPDSEVLGPLLISIANTVRQMPKLQSAAFNIGSDLSGALEVELQCVTPGFTFDNPLDSTVYLPSDGRAARVWVGLSNKWELPLDVKAAWKRWLGEDGKLEFGTMRTKF